MQGLKDLPDLGSNAPHLEIRKTGVDGNLDGLSGTFRARKCALRLAKQFVDLWTEVNMQRFDVDPGTDSSGSVIGARVREQ